MIGAVLLVLAALMPAAPGAQTAEATISGVITDATGGALPGVSVTATHGQTGQRHGATSNAEGVYALRSLPIGPYVIEAELSGFHRYRGEGLTLTTGATVPLDIKLSIGELTDTVTVSAEAPLLSARTSEMSQLIESRSVEGMPLGAAAVVQHRRLRAAGAVHVRQQRTGHPARGWDRQRRRLAVQERVALGRAVPAAARRAVQRPEPRHLRAARAHVRSAELRRGVERIGRAHGPARRARGVLNAH
jgi:hypothetical protein